MLYASISNTSFITLDKILLFFHSMINWVDCTKLKGLTIYIVEYHIEVKLQVQKKDRGEIHLIQHLYIRAGKLIQHTR